MNGWIKIHCKMTEWEWYKDVNTKSLFLHLLLTANYKDRKYKGMVIHKGELITGRKLLAEETGLSEQNIRTSLNKLKSTNELTIKSTSKGTLISIVNWDKYQCLGNDTNQQINQQPNQRLTTPKEYKNIRNIYIGEKLPTYDTSKNKNISDSEANELLKLMGRC